MLLIFPQNMKARILPLSLKNPGICYNVQLNSFSHKVMSLYNYIGLNFRHKYESIFCLLEMFQCQLATEVNLNFNPYPAGNKVHVISLSHYYKGQARLNHPCSLTRLYTVDWPTLSSHLDIPKNDNGQFQKWKVDYFI